MPLGWFRRKAKQEQAPLEAAVLTLEEPDRPTTTAAPELVPDADGQQTGTKKRRRGSRGGRGRKKRPAGAVSPTADAAEPDEQSDEKAATGRTSDRKGRTQARPRRSPPRRAPLPKAKRELLVSVDPGEKRVAVIEDGVVAEVYLERPEQRSIAGNVYLGTVDNVLPGMEAAFVEIGLEKNGFLYVDEIVGPELEGRRGARKIQDLIQRGQTVLVQAVKDPMKTKGARLTTEISLPGRFVVYVPHGDGLGVSRRLDDDERNRLKGILKDLAPKTGGVIVRTAAEGASAEDIGRDLEFLQRLWSTIEASAKKASAPALIYQEAELPLRVTRDLFTGDFERLLVDHDRTHKRIVGYLKKTSPHMVDRVTRYKEREPLLEAFGVEQEIKSTLSRRVDLPSGGYLIFDYAEAFTVIDVNTGRFVGSRSKRNGPGRLEDTITKNNLEAVKEVVRQLRLRDVGGIIVIDFIDMANPKNRQQVEDALRQELERDRTKTYVVEISPLGLVEMTRQNVTDGPREVMTRKCPTCGGDGIIVSEDTAAVEVERRLRALVTPGSRAKAFKVELNARVAGLIVGDGTRLQELEDVTKRRFFFVGVEDVHLDHMRVLEQGPVEKLAPAAPVEVGEELELKLGELGLYDARAGVGKFKGIEVVVADAAKLVGKKVQVRIVAVMDGVAYAVQAGCGAGRAADHCRGRGRAADPPAARSQGRRRGGGGARPKPRKSSRPRNRTRRRLRAGPGSAVPPRNPLRARPRRPRQHPSASARASLPLPKLRRRAEAEDEPDAEAPAEGEAPAAPKKRTRRGTRGGRNRKRKTPAAETAEANGDLTHPAEEEEPAVEEAPPAPVIHVPDRELGQDDDEEESADDETPAGRSTRRGSRGGRNRRKKPSVATADNGDGGEPVATAQKESDGDEGEWEYTPMSEWGDV